MNSYLKQRGILLQELGQVTVPERADQYHILVLVRVLSFQGPGHDQHRLDSPHTEVIVVLLGELLAAQLVHLYHLLGQILG